MKHPDFPSLPPGITLPVPEGYHAVLLTTEEMGVITEARASEAAKEQSEQNAKIYLEDLRAASIEWLGRLNAWRPDHHAGGPIRETAIHLRGGTHATVSDHQRIIKMIDQFFAPELRKAQ